MKLWHTDIDQMIDEISSLILWSNYKLFGAAVIGWGLLKWRRVGNFDSEFVEFTQWSVLVKNIFIFNHRNTNDLTIHNIHIYSILRHPYTLVES